MNKKIKTLDSIKWTTLSTIIIGSVQLLQIFILARFLEPSAFGILSMIMIIIGFTQIFIDFGISTAIIHKQDATINQLSTLYWLNIISSIFIFIIIVILSPYISIFYNEPQLNNLIILTSTTIIIQSFGKQFFVLFEKELQFNIVSKIDIFSVLLGFVLSIVLAVNNYEIYALIYPLILTSFIKTLLLMINGLKYHRPKIYFNIFDVKEFIVFGIYQMGNSLVNYFNSQFDIIIIGKLFGSDTLGLYSIAKQLVMRPAQIINPIVTRVSFPMMSKVQNDTLRLKEIYLKSINYLSTVNFYVYMIMIILSKEIITIFLGEKWITIITLFELLSIYSMLRSVGNPIGSLILAKGKPHYEFYWNLILLFFIPITIFISSKYGINGVAFGLIILVLMEKIPNWYFLVYPLCKASFKDYFITILVPLNITVFCAVVVCIFLYILNIDIFIFKICLTISISIIIFITMNYFFNKDFYNTIISLIRRK